jgi:hypothetical protein
MAITKVFVLEFFEYIYYFLYSSSKKESITTLYFGYQAIFGHNLDLIRSKYIFTNAVYVSN